MDADACNSTRERENKAACSKEGSHGFLSPFGRPHSCLLPCLDKHPPRRPCRPFTEGRAERAALPILRSTSPRQRWPCALIVRGSLSATRYSCNWLILTFVATYSILWRKKRINQYCCWMRSGRPSIRGGVSWPQRRFVWARTWAVYANAAVRPPRISLGPNFFYRSFRTTGTQTNGQIGEERGGSRDGMEGTGFLRKLPPVRSLHDWRSPPQAWSSCRRNCEQVPGGGDALPVAHIARDKFRDGAEYEDTDSLRVAWQKCFTSMASLKPWRFLGILETSRLSPLSGAQANVPCLFVLFRKWTVSHRCVRRAIKAVSIRS